MNTVIQIPIPQPLLEEKRALLAARGFKFSADKGKGAFKAIEFDYEYSNGILTLTITKKPALIPLSLVKSKLAEWTGVNPQEKTDADT